MTNENGLAPVPWLVWLIIFDDNGKKIGEAHGFLVNDREVVTAYHVAAAAGNDPHRLRGNVPHRTNPQATVPALRFDRIFRVFGEFTILHLAEPYEIDGPFPAINFETWPSFNDEIIIYCYDLNNRYEQQEIIYVFDRLAPPQLADDQRNVLYRCRAQEGFCTRGHSGAPVLWNGQIIGLLNAGRLGTFGTQEGGEIYVTPFIGQYLQFWMYALPTLVEVIWGALLMTVRFQLNQGSQSPPLPITAVINKFEDSDSTADREDEF
jgi:hypothetical protein